MGPVGKIIVGGLAVLGGVTLAGAFLAPVTSLSLYSPYMPRYDLIKIRGSTLLRLLARGGGDTPPVDTQGAPFPVALRLRLFDRTGSFAEDAYESLTGKPFRMEQILE